MNKFDFNYLLKRNELIGEMARTTTIFNPISVDFNTLYEKLIKDEIDRGNTSIGTRQLIVWRFIMSTLNDFLIERGKGYTKKEEGVGKVPLTSKELSKKFGGGTSHGQTKAAVLEMVKAHKNVANDPEVRNFLNEPENMEEFKRNAGFSGDSSTSGARKGKINALKDVTGMGLDETESLTSTLHSKIVQMNRAMASRKAKSTRKGVEYVPKDSDNVEIENPDISSAMEIVYFIDAAIKEDEVTGGNFSKTALNDLKYLRNMYQATIDGGQGATIEEFITFVNKLKNMKGMSDDRIEALDAVLYEIESLESASGDQPSVSELANTPTQNKIEGYDQDVINKILDTPELKTAFSKWLSNHRKWRETKNSKLEQRLEKKMADVGYDKFIAKRPDMEGNNETFVNPAIMQLINQIQKYEKELETTDDDLQINKLKGKIKNLQDKISEIRKNLNTTEEDAEDGVMGYMSEQIWKDRRTNVIGEFKERGYKKFKNYNHWLSTNQEI
jgi:hypothetical protein